MTVLYTLIVNLARILNVLILIRVLLSWMPVNRSNPIISLIYQLTEPILAPIRRLLPSLGGLDISPIIAMLLIEIVQRLLIALLVR